MVKANETKKNQLLRSVDRWARTDGRTDGWMVEQEEASTRGQLIYLDYIFHTFSGIPTVHFHQKHRSKRPFSMLGSTGNDSISILSSFELVFVHLNVIHRPTASTQPKNVVASREMFMCGKTPSKRTIHNLCFSGFSCCMPNGKNSLLCRHSKLQTLHIYVVYCIFAFDDFTWRQ